MKKILFTLTYLFAGILCIHAQVLYGITPAGGSDAGTVLGGGTIIKLNAVTNKLEVVKSFDATPLIPDPKTNTSGYYTNLIQAADGKLYGMTSFGGSFGAGMIFTFDTATFTYKKLKNFDFTNGAHPCGSLALASDGKLYGMTSESYRGWGEIFCFDPSTSTITVLKEFNLLVEGIVPKGNLIVGSDGKLYGMTSTGGGIGNGYYYGVIFSFDLKSSNYTKLYDFDNTDGANPIGSLLQAADGRLYGMTKYGGTNNDGVIFSLDPKSLNYTKLYEFNYTDGAYPLGSLIQTNDGKLCGMTSSGGIGHGLIFSFDPSTPTYTKLHAFNNADGSPNGSLTQATNGKLYGMTESGYTFNNGLFLPTDGVIFSFDLSGLTYAKLKDFNGSDGGNPMGSLTQASNGKLYGMASLKNSRLQGVLFSFDPSSCTYSMKDLAIIDEGTEPRAKLTQAINGKFYGVTGRGGSGNGVIFSFDPKSSNYTKLHQFEKSDGPPLSSLLQANDGKLYGTTISGETGDGVIFSFDPLSSNYTKLHEFNKTDGASPWGSLIQASDGKLYGMTSSGGIGNGVIFSFDLSSSSYQKLYQFHEYELGNIDGVAPLGSLMQASDGKLYGMTSSGGNGGYGVIFYYDPVSSTYKKLKEFSGADGRSPYGSLMQAKDGKLYGMTSFGGTYNYGIIFCFDLSMSNYTKLYDFNGIDGSSPEGDLMQATNGKICGMTSHGGTNSHGVIFTFDLASLHYTKLQDFNGYNGSGGGIGCAFIEVNECTADTTYYRDADSDGYGNLYDSLKACNQAAGYVKNNTDCNDNNAAIHAPATYYRDVDGDGFGDASHSISVCESLPPAGYVTNNYDCEDIDRPGKGRDERVVMCHNGKPQCVKVKEIDNKLRQGWALGPCNNACGTDYEKLMAKEQFIKSGYSFINYPNPFTSTCTIQYQLPFDSKVSIKVYDVLGRPVAVLVNDYKKAGVYTINFNAGNLNKGLLLLKIIATSNEQQFEQTNKLVLVK